MPVLGSKTDVSELFLTEEREVALPVPILLHFLLTWSGCPCPYS